MRNASMKVLKNLVCCAAFICLMFVLAMPAHAASKADELLQLVNAERAQAGVAPLSMGSSALNAAAQARAKELTVNYSYNRPNGSREFTILPEYGVDDVSVGENYWAAAEDASDVVAAWNRYDFFKERMLDKDATSVGIGYYEGGEYGNYWVMIFTYARGTSENGFAQEVLALVNAERAKENLAPLAMGDAKLQAAADERAKEVAKVASHTRPDGTNCFTVLKEYGVSDRRECRLGRDHARKSRCRLDGFGRPPCQYHGPRRQVYVPWLQLRCQFSVGPQLDPDLRKVSG